MTDNKTYQKLMKFDLETWDEAAVNKAINDAIDEGFLTWGISQSQNPACVIVHMVKPEKVHVGGEPIIDLIDNHIDRRMTDAFNTMTQMVMQKR